MALSVAIMGVPSRRSLYRGGMLNVLPDGVQIIEDTEGRGVFPTAFRAWSSYNPQATHHLVLHDDLLLPLNFMSLVTNVMERNPENVLSFHAFSVKIHDAFQSGAPWAVCKQISGQANLYPVLILERLMGFCKHQLKPKMPLKPGKKFLSDAAAVNMFLRVEHRKAYMPLPNFVQHAAPRDGVAGQNNLGKISPCYIGDYPGAKFDWSFDKDLPYPTVYPYKRREHWEWDYYIGPSPFKEDE